MGSEESRVSDRLKGFVVVLDTDIREDDAENIRIAIAALRNVISVSPVPTDMNDHFARTRVKHELREKLWEIVTD